jgi:gamma-glutamyltranspeptidase/glutathione hydrolase
MVFRDGRLVMPFGTPGGDVQAQAMLQVLLNLVVFGMSPQQAVEAPRVATQSFPNSFWPHRYFPGRVTLEGRIPEATATALAERGHGVERWSDWEWKAGAVCLVHVDEAGVLRAAADPRRDSYALAW